MSTNGGTKSWYVREGPGRTAYLQADSVFVTDEGRLIFRDYRAEHGPGEIVAIYEPGAWEAQGRVDAVKAARGYVEFEGDEDAAVRMIEYLWDLTLPDLSAVYPDLVAAHSKALFHTFVRGCLRMYAMMDAAHEDNDMPVHEEIGVLKDPFLTFDASYKESARAAKRKKKPGDKVGPQ